jgi:3-phosphoshikimate 1-carboxyvinyltransferase
MKSVISKPGHLSGHVVVPPSKSNSLRALLFASLSDQPSRIENLLVSPDTECMKRALTHLQEGLPIDCGNSGITFRFITALAALKHRPITITGDHSLQTLRPSHALIEGLEQLGCRVISNGFAPITVQGPLRGGHALLSGRDSQPVSALLIACSLAGSPTTLTVEPMGEKPWIALTLSWLKRAGIDITQTGNQFYISGNARPQPIDIIGINVYALQL